jgi:hypothetical protein
MTKFLIDDEEEQSSPSVCVTHLKFLPCRTCLYSEIKGQHSSDPKDIEHVRLYQYSEFNKMINPESQF